MDTTVPARFQPGKATRAEVILALGEPDAVSANERTLAYRTEKVRAILMVGGYGAGAAAPISKDEYLVFDFDARGKLVSSRTSGHWGHADLGRTLGTSTTPANNSGWSGDATWLVGVGCSMNKVRESAAHTLAPADQPANPAVNVSAAQARHSPIKKLRTKSSLGGFILARLFGQIEVV